MPSEIVRFGDLARDAIAQKGSPACVGLDPVVERIPSSVPGIGDAARIESFCAGVIDAVARTVPFVKPQSACFERYGSAGVGVLERVVRRAREAGLVVILDAKRADIGVTAEHYAFAARALGAHAITLSGYMGASSIEPFLKAGLGAFVLVRTSNPDSDHVQACELRDGRSVAEAMADLIAEIGRVRVGASGYCDLGAVVGATKASDASRIRARLPSHWFLVPGYGAQGGTIDDVRGLLDSRAGGVIVNASRSVLYPSDASGDWRHAIARAAWAFRDDLAGVARA